MHPEIFQVVYIEFKMTVNQPLFTSIGLTSGKCTRQVDHYWDTD